jgi:23S rRNA pseudouridine1911/1915/1917 synthase
LALELETGRRNQIRAHLFFLGCPVAGDKKYGARTDPLGRLALHAETLCFYHPANGQRMEFVSPGFSALVKQRLSLPGNLRP